MKSDKYIRLLLLFLLLAITFNADARRKKRKKKNAPVEKTVAPVQVNKVDSSAFKNAKANTQITTNSKPQEEIKLAQLVVSFASMGAGIDAKARQQFLEHLTWFNTKHNIELMYDKKNWGREGEVDYCFYGNNGILIPMLYKELSEKLAGAKKVFIKQNFPCK
jgi:hypothetical protein